MEALKNGFISSSKYESCTKTFPVPHVIVFSNELPDENKFSSGRLKIHKLCKPKKKDDGIVRSHPEEKPQEDAQDPNDIIISDK